MIRIYFALPAALLLTSCGPRGADQMKVVVTQPVHPVLIRNPHNVLLEVTIDSASPSAASLTSMEFALEGTGNLADLESLELFQTGDKDKFSAAESRFGKSAQPALAVSFQGEYPLKQGANVFSLSCRLKPDADLLRTVGAKLVSINTSAGAFNLGESVKVRPKRIGVALRRHNDDNVHTYRIPALATGPKGSLHSVYDMRRRKSRDLQEDIDIGLSRSVDGGRTWEAPRVIMDMGTYNGKPQEENGVSDPGIVIDQKTGEIIVFAVWMWGKLGKHQWNGDGSEPGFEIGKSAQMMMVRSRDDGMTWSKPENLTRKLKKSEWWLLAPSPQQGINLADGTLSCGSRQYGSKCRSRLSNPGATRSSCV